MPISQSAEAPRKALRLWPGVVAVGLQWLARFVPPLVVPGSEGTAILAGLVGGVAVIAWWLLFSRAPWSDRALGIALMVGAVLAMFPLVHESVANGMMGLMLPIFSVPLLSLALVIAAAAGRHLAPAPRRAFMAVALLLACGVTTLVRTEGVTGDGGSELHWRWTQTPEERLLAQARDEPRRSGAPESAGPVPAPGSGTTREPAAPAPAPAVPERSAEGVPARPAVRAADPVDAHSHPEWPGFRGPARDAVVRGVRIETDWARTPPVELWRRPVGPGWSSFAVWGDLVYTQEQRGDEEVVSCYRLTTGEPVWRHRDPVRFWESNGGAGPRATPTVRDGRVYTLGATGVVNALDARTGSLLWSRHAAGDANKEVPDWGFAGSPLAIDDLVIVALAGQLMAYDVRTGDPRWFGPPEGGGYSSPHLATIDGVVQVLLLRGRRTTSVDPADGRVLWEDSWQPAVSILQPALVQDRDVLIAAGEGMSGMGIRRIAVAHGPAGWSVEERWTSRGLKPYFNDFVVHGDLAFGFDGSILACIDLADGARKWKGGRYGHGQLLLIPDAGVLLVLSEEGELALVRAAPDGFAELARSPALEGKTWNHPVLVGNVLLVRNGEQMAAFRLPAAGE